MGCRVHPQLASVIPECRDILFPAHIRTKGAARSLGVHSFLLTANSIGVHSFLPIECRQQRVYVGAHFFLPTVCTQQTVHGYTPSCLLQQTVKGHTLSCPYINEAKSVGLKCTIFPAHLSQHGQQRVYHSTRV